MLLLCAFLVGLVAGLRSMTAPAVTSWCAHLGIIVVAGTPLAWMGSRTAVIVLTVFAVVELIYDKLPSCPSRKAPPGFIARMVAGALCGATLGAASHAYPAGIIAGILGALAGTYGGSAARARLAAAFHRDLPAALFEDAAAILIAVFAILKLQ
ncbi:MAG TPA: DUF4126 family protein [Acidobacteriaceae bacterium]|jgi:uncharacterized membrane protein|nr:DUF4126 family protein [Acidobacteriaceae bacterium]